MFDSPLRRHLCERCGLSGTPLNLLVTIVRLSRNADGHCWAGASFLADCIERGARTVRAALAELRRLGLVHTGPRYVSDAVSVFALTLTSLMTAAAASGLLFGIVFHPFDACIAS